MAIIATTRRKHYIRGRAAGRLADSMIYDTFGNLRVTSSPDRLVLEEAGLLRAGRIPFLFRLTVGPLLIAVGGLVIYAILGTGGLKPIGNGLQGAMAWLLVAVFIGVVGVVPVYWGLTLLGRRVQQVFDSRQRALIVSVRYFGLLCYRRHQAFTDFDRVEISVQLRGAKAKRWLHVVACRGPKASQNVVACEEAERAMALAEQIAERIGLPVTHPFALAS